MIPGETILSGAPAECPDCHVVVELQVLKSGAGWYIGTMCECGPYSRESVYFATAEAANAVLDQWKAAGVPDHHAR